MKIFRFNEFITEAFSIGAGITFNGSSAMTVIYEISSNNLRNIRTDVRVNTFSADGFGVTFPNASTWLVYPDNTSIKQVKREFFKKINIVDNSAQICKTLNIQEAEFGTINDLLKANPDVVLTIKITAGYNYKQTHFKGYSRGVFRKDDVVMGEVDSLDDGYTSIFINGIAAVNNESIIKELAPTLKASGRFVEFFDEVFNEKGKAIFVKDEVRSMAIAGKLDSEITEIIDTIGDYEGWVIKKFIKDIKDNKTALDDLISFLSDKEVMSEIDARWTTSLNVEYSAKIDPVA